MDKHEIANVLEEIAFLLEMKNANPFRVRAYRNAARALLNTEKDLNDLIQEKALSNIEGIGEDLAGKITKLAKTGKLAFYENLKKSVPKSAFELREVHGLGAKKIQVLQKKLKIHSLKQLEKACKEGKLEKIAGFGKKTEQNILNALSKKEIYSQRKLWWEANQLAKPIVAALKKLSFVLDAEVAGSLRRCLETVGDLDFLVSSKEPKKVMKWFTEQEFVGSITSQGETKASIRMKGGFQADLRVVLEKEFGFALLYFTGSKEHNVKLRERALKKGWSVSEYGITLTKKGAPPRLPSSPTEEDIYKAMGLSYIPPEIREDQGEIQAAEKKKLPHLIEVKDIRGTFHNHTTASDGKNTLSEMVDAAGDMGWEYIGISDHSKSSFQANGLTVERLEKSILDVQKINNLKKKPYVFIGTECDILPNGKLDYPDSILKELDFVIASVHSALSQDEKNMTARIIKAIEHPLTTMIGHLTGRILLQRDPYKVNISKIIDACIANGKIIEINGHPQRLDMDWRFWHGASERGLLTCINTDAHHVEDLVFVETGVNVARKGWLEKKHVINTMTLAQIKKFLKK